ncbi:MAG TPA: LacI family DNA-binding transcriptional regulator [Acidobacteriaceae bacterium]|nr:LacI family DNA-binding transcriptional regulator [Acidobacteriaceae bacterium]
MKDIAKDLGISIVTVSKVLHNHTDISPATRMRVLRRMKELNYQPNLNAQGLASGHSYMIGLIVPDLVHAFFSEVARSLAYTIRQRGFGLLISSSSEDPQFEQEEIALMIRRRVDVLIVASCQPNSRSLQKAAEELPLILLDRQFSDFPTSFVGTNDVLVGELATEHLIRTGCRRIAHIGGTMTSTSVHRLQGYMNALLRHHLPIRDEYIIRRKRADEAADKSGWQAMNRLLRLSPRPDGVFCYNDPAAVGAMNAVIAAGLRIPDDISVIGAGNIRYAESFRVPLSSVDVPSTELGEHAGKLALQLAENANPPRPRFILVQPKLLLRESCRRESGTRGPADPDRHDRKKDQSRSAATRNYKRKVGVRAQDDNPGSAKEV